MLLLLLQMLMLLLLLNACMLTMCRQGRARPAAFIIHPRMTRAHVARLQPCSALAMRSPPPPFPPPDPSAR